MTNDSIKRAQDNVLKATSASLPVRDQCVKEALELLESVDPQLRDLICGADDEIIALVSTSTTGEEIEELNAEARPLTHDERCKLEGEILFAKIFGADDVSSLGLDQGGHFKSTLVEDLRDLVRQTMDAVLAAARRGDQRPLDVLDSTDFLESHNLLPRKLTVGNELIRQLATLAEESEPNSLLTQFLSGYAGDDRATMRKAVREMVRA